MKSLYKVGDKVLIKKKYDPGFKDKNYRYRFLNDMVKNFGGTIATITKIDIGYDGKYDHYILPDDGYKYKLNNSNGSWASSMFEEEF